MEAITIESEKDRYVISIDKQAIDKEYVYDLLKSLHTEQLAQKMNIDDSILEIGEQIKLDWWEQNKHKFEDLK